MNRARMLLSGPLLRQALHMPDDIQIIGASMYASGAEIVELILIGPDLPDDDEAEAPPLVMPTITEVRDFSGEVVNYIWNWGDPQ